MMDSKKYVIAILILGVIFFLPFLGYVHLFDWDEINFAESAREMIVTGNYFQVQINFNPFWEKPPFFLWLQVLSMKLFGINEFAARFPNALFGIITVVTLFFIGKRHHSEKFGFLWALLLLGSILPHMYFKSGIIDPVFNYFIFLSIYFLALNIQHLEARKKIYFSTLSGIFIGFAIITKGPVGLLLVLLTFVGYISIKKFRKKVRVLDVLFFALSAFVVSFSWFGYEMIQNGPWFLVEFIQYQIELFSKPVAGHEQPFYYHFVVVLLGCFPMSIIAIGGFNKVKGDQPIDFLLWSKVLFWVVLILFSIVKTKIVHYSSMAYLPLSYIAAYYLNEAIEKREVFAKYIKALLVVFGFIFSILLIAVPVLFFKKEFLMSLLNDPFAEASLQVSMGWTGWEFLCGAVYLIGMGFGLFFLFKNKIQKGIYILTLSAGITLLSYSIFIVPKIEKFSQGPAIEFFIDKSEEDAYIATLGYKSYAHYFYGKVEPLSPEDRLYLQKQAFLQEKGDEELNVIELNGALTSWLLNGDIDKTTYFSTKITSCEDMKKYSDIQFLYNKGGFDFYVRYPKE